MTDNDRLAAARLAQMNESERTNAGRLGFVSLGIHFEAPSFVATTVDITAEIIAEETRLRAENCKHATAS